MKDIQNHFDFKMAHKIINKINPKKSIENPNPAKATNQYLPVLMNGTRQTRR